ncbi:MAG TPA: serine protease [Lacipirellulaceae bacterium]|jgi:hypothetical protein|nr:serine protease [Lacipirellulaceae bacterium]
MPLLILAALAGHAPAQCYVDPYTGQRFCSRPCENCPQAGSYRQVTAQSPGANNVTSEVNSAAHCRITVDNRTLGSGTLIASDQSIGLVLTCAHLFEDSTSQIIVAFPRGSRFAAKLVDIDQGQDLAAIVIRRPEIAPLVVADGEPAGALTACGFGSDGVFRCVQGGITGHATAAGAAYASTTIGAAVRPGDSGGGVLNTSGQIVGVVWGQRDGQTYATCGYPVCEFLERVRGKVFPKAVVASKKPIANPTPATPKQSPPPQPQDASPQPDWQAITDELDSRLRALDSKKQDKGDYLQPGDLNGYLRADDASKLTGPLALKAEVENKLSDLSSRFESVHSVVDSVKQHVEQISADKDGFLQGVSYGKVAVGALGLSGPLAAAVIAAAGLLGLRLKSRLTHPQSSATIATQVATPASSKSQPIAVDSPPPPQQAVPETHYVPVEQDSFAKAHQWASEHVARKYPGATEVLQTQESLIKQFLASKRQS